MSKKNVQPAETTWAFVDGPCTHCGGIGCTACYGTGVYGSLREITVAPPRVCNTHLGAALRSYRLCREYSIRHMAACLGMSPSGLSELENGLRRRLPRRLKKRLKTMLRRGHERGAA